MVSEYEAWLPNPLDEKTWDLLFKGTDDLDFYVFEEGSQILVRCLDLIDTKTFENRGIHFSKRESTFDEENFGRFWPEVQKLFVQATRISKDLYLLEDRPPFMNPGKIVHCLMNIWGMSRRDEVALYGLWMERHRRLLGELPLGDKGKVRGAYSF